MPHLGTVRMQKLQPVNLVKLYSTLLNGGGKEGRPLSARSVGHTHRVLHRALGHAVQWGVVLRNAADSATPPLVEEKEVEILQEGDVKGLLEKLRGRSIYMIARLGLATGVRRGEMLATRVDIDLKAGKIKITRSLEQTKAGGLRFKPPKTKKGKRTITIPPTIVSDLSTHRIAQQDRERHGRPDHLAALGTLLADRHAHDLRPPVWQHRRSRCRDHGGGVLTDADRLETKRDQVGENLGGNSVANLVFRPPRSN